MSKESERVEVRKIELRTKSEKELITMCDDINKTIDKDNKVHYNKTIPFRLRMPDLIDVTVFSKENTVNNHLRFMAKNNHLCNLNVVEKWRNYTPLTEEIERIKSGKAAMNFALLARHAAEAVISASYDVMFNDKYACGSYDLNLVEIGNKLDQYIQEAFGLATVPKVGYELRIAFMATFSKGLNKYVIPIVVDNSSIKICGHKSSAKVPSFLGFNKSAIIKIDRPLFLSLWAASKADTHKLLNEPVYGFDKETAIKNIVKHEKKAREAMTEIEVEAEITENPLDFLDENEECPAVDIAEVVEVVESNRQMTGERIKALNRQIQQGEAATKEINRLGAKLKSLGLNKDSMMALANTMEKTS